MNGADQKKSSYIISEIGCYWTPSPRISPAIVTAMDTHRRRLDPAVRICRDRLWILNYVFDAGHQDRFHSLRGAWRSRPAGSGLLIAPGVPFWERLSQPVHAAWIIFWGGELMSLPSFVGRQGWCLFEDPDRLLGSRLSQLARETYEKRDNAFPLGQAGLWDICHLLHRAERRQPGVYAVSAPKPPGNLSSFCIAVQEYLAAHVADSISLEEIARHVGTSVSGLAHRYKAEANEAPMRTHLRLRLRAAKGLLVQGYKLQAVADETGFSSPSHLSTIFKRIEGVSPTEFLKLFARREPLARCRGAQFP